MAKKQGPFLDELKKRYGVRNEYVRTLGNEIFLYPNLIIKTHIIVLIALSGGGKTTFLYFHVMPELVKAGYKVWYFDADSPPSDHKMMKKFADQHGFEFLIPDVNKGTSMESLLGFLKAMANDSVPLDGHVFVFDTLKKFSSLMDKKSTKDFFVLVRKLTKLGVTVIMPGHANKHRDYDGNLVYEGVGDVRSDTDELIYFEHEKNPDGSIDVSTVVDSDRGAKVRGIFESFSFNIAKDRTVKIYNQPISIKKPRAGVVKATDEEIIQTAADYIKTQKDPVNQSQLVEGTQGLLPGRAGTNKITKVIRHHSSPKGEPHAIGVKLVYAVGDKNSRYYELP